MRHQTLLILSVLALAQLACAQSLGEFAQDFSIPFELSVDKVPESFQVDMYVVYGEGTDSFEKMIMDSLTLDPSAMKSYAIVTIDGVNTTKEVTIKNIVLSENETSLDALANGAGIVVLVGGSGHNNLTSEAYAGGMIENETKRFSGSLLVANGRIDSDTKLMILAHNVVEGERLERKAVEYSPLKGIIPDEYIPVAATGIGMFLMGAGNIFKTIAEFLALDFGRKKKTFGHTGKRIAGVYVNEAGALLGAAFVLGFAVTWTFTGPTTQFFDLILLNSGICLFAALSHELSHRIMGRIFGVQIEYRFWPMGSTITIITAFLGNSFGIQGFLMEKADDKIANWKYGLTKIAAPLVSLALTVAFSTLYLKDPKVIYQMVYTTASIWAMAEIVPVRGLDGYDIRQWSRWIWLAAFIVISYVYFTVNFVY